MDGSSGATADISPSIALSKEDQAKLDALKKKRQRTAQDFHVSLYSEGSLGLCSGMAVDDFSKNGYFTVRSAKTASPTSKTTGTLNADLADLRAFVMGKPNDEAEEKPQYYIPSLIVNCARGLKPPNDGLEVQSGVRVAHLNPQSNEDTTTADQQHKLPPPVVIRHLPSLPNDPWHVESVFTRKEEDEKQMEADEIAREKLEVEQHFSEVEQFVTETLANDARDGWSRRSVFIYLLPLEDNKTQRLTPFLLSKATELISRINTAVVSGVDTPGCPFPPQQQSTLFHCVAGKSRSVCMLAAVMMSDELLTRSQRLLYNSVATGSDEGEIDLSKLETMPSLFLTTFSKIQAGRPEADPNSWFRLQMVKFGQYLLDAIKTRPSSLIASPRPAGHSRVTSSGGINALPGSPTLASPPGERSSNQ